MRRFAFPLVIFGFFAVSLGLVILAFTFYPVFLTEIQYRFRKPKTDVLVNTVGQNDSLSGEVIHPVDEDFGIVIPKIGANSRVIANVDPQNPKEYQLALTKGVAHAEGTVFPGEAGNVFIFSHSSANFYEAARYNSIFYLLSKMEKDDEIDLFYKKEKFKYRVTDKKIVNPKAVSYLSPQGFQKTVTLMTCWPAGTTLKRLVVVGEIAID